MKSIKKILCSFTAIVIVLLSISSIPVQAYNNNGSEYYAYEIDDANVVMDIQEDGKIHVREVYDVNFKIESQGLRRNLPVYNEFVGTINGKEIDEEFYLPVSDIKSNFPIEVEDSGDFTVVKMIDRDKYINGNEVFELSYTIDTKDLNRLNYSMFYWNIMSNTFDTTINNSEFTINFPKEFDYSQVFVYSGSVYDTDNVKYDVSVNANSVVMKSKEPLYANQNATLQVNLPEKYFVYPDLVPNNTLLIIGSGLSIVLSLVMLFVVAGKKEELVIISSFKAPDGMTSALVGKLMMSQEYLSVPAMFIEWANKGLLAFHEVIDEEKPKKKPKMYIEVLSDNIEQLQPYERILFNEYFSKVKADDKGKRIVSLNSLGNKKVFEAYNAARTSVSMTMKDMGLSMFTPRSIGAAVGLSLNVLHVVAFLALVTSNFYFVTSSMSIFAFIIGILNLVINVAIVSVTSMKYTKPKVTKTVYAILSLISLAGTAFMSINLLNSKVSMVAVLLYVFAVLTLLVAQYQVLRTSKESALALGQILGFKEYISMVEMDSLKVNIEEQPNLFFAVLPYAYIFGLTKLWVEKFKLLDNIQPDWYHATPGSTFTYWYWYSVYTSSTRRAVTQSHYRYDPSTTRSVGSGSSGGSFGGGFGGGGFSGGGFGGGGGGRL